MNIEGKIVIEGDKHEVEYEPSGMTGLSTLYLRVKGVPHNTPIYIDQIGDVIEMLERGRRAIQALEEENRMLRDAAQRRVDCGHDDECGGRQKDRCGCGHTELENALEMLLP